MDEFKVLIVDDDDDIRQVLQYNLNKEGFQTETASDGLDCLKKVDLFNPDIILLDVMMPDMDGIEVCDRIKTNPKTQKSAKKLTYKTSASSVSIQNTNISTHSNKKTTNPSSKSTNHPI